MKDEKLWVHGTKNTFQCKPLSSGNLKLPWQNLLSYKAQHNTTRLHITGVEACENWFAWVHRHSSDGQGVQGRKVPIGGWVTPASRPLGHWLTKITTGSLPHQTRPPSPIGALVKEYQTLAKLYTRYREPFAQHDKTLQGTWARSGVTRDVN